MSAPIKIVAFAGSLRKASYNRMLLNAAVKLAPANAQIEVPDWSKVPVFNADDEKTNYNPVAAAIKEQVRAADAVLIVSPEYNYSIPGPLKNLVDTLSRPYGTSPFAGKAVSVIGCNDGAYPGSSGTMRAQIAWKPVFTFLNLTPLQQPEIIMAGAPNHFDKDGNLTNDYFKGRITDHMRALVDLAAVLKSAKK